MDVHGGVTWCAQRNNIGIPIRYKIQKFSTLTKSSNNFIKFSALAFVKSRAKNAHIHRHGMRKNASVAVHLRSRALAIDTGMTGVAGKIPQILLKIKFSYNFDKFPSCKCNQKPQSCSNCNPLVSKVWSTTVSY